MTAQELKEVISRLGLSQARIAKLMHVDRSAISHWTTGVRPITGRTEAHLLLLAHVVAELKYSSEDISMILHLTKSKMLS